MAILLEQRRIKVRFLKFSSYVLFEEQVNVFLIWISLYSPGFMSVHQSQAHDMPMESSKLIPPGKFFQHQGARKYMLTPDVPDVPAVLLESARKVQE